MSKSELSPLLINEEPSGRAHVEEVVDFSQHVATSDDIGSSRQTEVLSRHYRSFNVTPIANEWSKLLKKKKPVRKKAKRVMVRFSIPSMEFHPCTSLTPPLTYHFFLQDDFLTFFLQPL